MDFKQSLFRIFHIWDYLFREVCWPWILHCFSSKWHVFRHPPRQSDSIHRSVWDCCPPLLFSVSFDTLRSSNEMLQIFQNGRIVFNKNKHGLYLRWFLAQCSWSHENIKVCSNTFENLEIGIIDPAPFLFLETRTTTLRLAFVASQKQRWRMKPMEPTERPVMCPSRRVAANQAARPTML